MNELRKNNMAANAPGTELYTVLQSLETKAPCLVVGDT